MDGDTLIVGAEGADAPETGSGAVYVFVQNDGSWSALQKLVASDGHLSASFGHSLSIQGDTVVVGAEGTKHDEVASGAAYVFVRSAGTWTEIQKLVASDASVSDRFGTSVLVHGDTIVVGAEAETSGAGSAYIFKKDSEGVWIETQKIMASDAGPPDFFGHSLAMNDNTLVVGAVSDDDKGTSSGSASIFTLSAGVWVESQKITASDGSANDRFGDSVTIGENTIVVGAHANADGGANTGAAYVYMNQGGAWNETQKLLADNATGGDWFGFSVHLDGEMLAIGAPYDDVDGVGANAGSTYLYTRTGTAWNEYRNFDASDSTGGDLFSYSLTLQNGTISLGARLDDDNGSGSGSVYIKVITPDCSSPILCNCETGFTGADCGTPICGDGLLVGSEACDDGNTVAGDGCSPTCRLTFSSPSTGYEMVFVPAGIFTMGCTPEMDVGDGCFEDESPAHTVILTNGFYIGATEITQNQYETVMGNNPSYFTECGGDCPVEMVGWPAAILYANAFSLLDGFTPAYETSGSGLTFQATWDPTATGYRLLTEAEWEYAARANQGTAYSGSNNPNDVAWTTPIAGGTTHPVAGLAPNANDLYDMSGNVAEWVWDRYHENYYSISPLEDPQGHSTAIHRVYRGGNHFAISGWDHKARLSHREFFNTFTIGNGLGIRLARPFVLCGNGVQEPGETCDDGNTTSFDGCSATCINENEANCQAILDAGLSTGDGIYTINPDGVGGLAPFAVYCDMTKDGGGWTLVLRGGANAGCRSNMIFGLATSLPPLDPIQLPISVLMFSKDTIEAIKTVGDSSTIGIRFTRDGAGSKFIPAACQIQFAPGTNDNTDCMTYTLSYSDTPTWSLGNVNGAADLSCANPLGTVGYSSNHIEAMGLYDCSVCFDAWGAGVALNGSLWVR
jgi:cysteine-rich repeat protein